MWRKLSQLLGSVLQSPSFSKHDIPNLSKIVAFCIFHISLVGNTTAVVVNSYIILYMCMEVIICQSDRSPERLMISQTPSIGGTSNQLRCGRRNVEETLPAFGISFPNSFLLKTGYPNFQNCGILDFPHFCICQYCSYGSELCY